MSISINNVKYLTKVIKEAEGEISKTGTKGLVRLAARSEAARLQLHLHGWNFDYLKMNAFKEKGNIRTYLE